MCNTADHGPVTRGAATVCVICGEGYPCEVMSGRARIKELEGERVGDVTDHARLVGLTAEVKRLETAGLQMYEANNVANARIQELEEELRHERMRPRRSGP